QIHIFSLRDVGNGVYDCWADFIQPWGPKAYVTWITLMVYIIPVLMLSICYGLISFKIWQNVKLKMAHGPNVGLSSSSCSGTAFARVSSTRLISKAKIRTVKMTFIIVLAFIVCWTPFFFVQMWSVWDTNAPQEGIAQLVFFHSMVLSSLTSLLSACLLCFPLSSHFHLLRDCAAVILSLTGAGFLQKSRPACELSVGKKSNSSSFVLSCRSTSQRSFMQPGAT
ncbi:MTR protein, partial [Columbina picui]|nr:MTR protein [Columbina picui]